MNLRGWGCPPRKRNHRRSDTTADERDGDLYTDAGVASGWSFGFDLGMNFLEIHGSVPRLRESGAICFLIRTYMLALADVAAVEPSRARMTSVLTELPDDLAEYKGSLPYRDRAVAWLNAYPSAQ